MHSSPRSNSSSGRQGCEGGTILVTGANGFLGSHVVYQLLEEGYVVRGTVRKPDDPRNAFLRTVHPSAPSNLELVPGDLMQSDGWDSAMVGVSTVMHVASPFQIDPNASEESFVKPAVKGTETVINAAIRNGVQRVVLTSSIASVTEGHPREAYRKGRTFTEEHWTDTESASTGFYEKSKALAELKAWSLVDGTALELVVINPGLIFGPVFDKSQGSSSASSDLVKKYVTRKYPALPPLTIGTVDVRDVAAAHLRGMQLPAELVAGQRFLCVAEVCSFKQHNIYLSNKLKPHGFKLSTHEVPSIAMPVATRVYDDLKQAKKTRMLHRMSAVSSEKIRSVMNMSWRPVGDTLYDHALSLMKVGILPQKKTPDSVLEEFTPYPTEGVVG